MNTHRYVMGSVGAALSVGMLIGATSPAQASPVRASTTAAPTSVAADPTLQQNAADLTESLTRLTSVPDEVLRQGDAATAAWLQSNGLPQPKGVVNTREADALRCAGAIALALGGTAFPAVKILKIKKLATELGGLKKAVDLMWGASFSYEKIQTAGGALGSLGAELFGIAEIRDQCFQ